MDLHSPRPSVRHRASGIALAAVVAVVVPARAQDAGSRLASQARFRQPVALSLSGDGGRLYAANARAGSLSVIDTAEGRVVSECDVGRSLADVALLPDGRRMVAVDRGAHALLLIGLERDRATVVARREVAADPVRLHVAPDGALCAVASTASRRVSLVPIAGGGRGLGAVRTIEVPFSPRELVGVAGGARLIVADAFGGKLAVLNAAAAKVESVRTLPACNIRGLALTPDGRTVAVAHQVLKLAAKTDFEDVHWGRLVTSHVQSLRVDALLGAESDEGALRGGCSIGLGFAGSGAGDPSAMLCDASGRVAVAVGGVDEVALSRSPTGYVKRVAVGRRPSALAASADGQLLYVADSLDDTISVVSIPEQKRLRTFALGPQPERTAVDRGERLFYDARLSHDGWMSCQSCHTDGQSNGLVADTLGDDSYGAPKRIPSLLGVGATGPWAWSGLIDRLEDQVRKSIRVTMQGRPPSDEQVADLTAYLRSLSSAPSPVAASEAAARGLQVFEDRDCARCHAPPHFTARGRYDVGLADEVGNRRFNPPSLLGVGRREPLLHDGRAAGLREVFVKHGHPHGSDWTAAEVDDLVAYLRSL